MSGPKTSRYTLTAEQRRILAEQRRIQQETQKNVIILKDNKAELKEIITRIDEELSQYERITVETGESNNFVEEVKQIRNRAIQAIIVLNPEYAEFYDEYLRTGENKIQNFTAQDGIISVGIHRREYESELDEKMQKMGLEEQKNVGLYS